MMNQLPHVILIGQLYGNQCAHMKTTLLYNCFQNEVLVKNTNKNLSLVMSFVNPFPIFTFSKLCPHYIMNLYCS